MGLLDIFESDSGEFERRKARFERISPFFDEAKQAFSILEKDYPEFVTDDLRNLFGRVGKKVDDEKWYVGTWQPKGGPIKLPKLNRTTEITKDTKKNELIGENLQHSEKMVSGEPAADADRGLLGSAVDMVMNGVEGAKQGFSDIMGAVSRSGQSVTGALGTLAREATKDSPLGISAAGRGLGMLSDAFGNAAAQWEQYGTNTEQYPEGFQRTMAKIAKGVNQAVGHAVVDIPAIMATPGGLPAYSGGMAMAKGLNKGEKGFELAKTAGKGLLRGALLQGILKGLGYLPKGSQIAGGAATFGGPSVVNELSKPKEKRDYSLMFTELLTGAGLMAFGKPGNSYKEVYRDAIDFYGKKKISDVEDKFKSFVEDTEKTAQDAERGKKVSFDDMVREEGEILRLVGEINKQAEKKLKRKRKVRNMPKMYLALKRKFMAEGLSEKEAKQRAAKIYNSKHPERPVHPGYHKKKRKKRRRD